MEPADSDDYAGTVQMADGTELPVTLDDDLVEAARSAGVDVDRLRSAAVPGDIQVKAQTDGDSATIPVQDRRQTDLTNRLRRDRDFQFIQDPQIQRLQDNSVNYTERVGRWLLTEDDLIPTIKERQKALIVGEDGITPEPADPDAEADQRLADVLEERYDGDIRPTEVIDTILRENLMNARAVLRATDLKELDLAGLDYLRDGVTGEEIYVQDQQTVHTFELNDNETDSDRDTDIIPGINLEHQTVDAQPLVIGEHVFDISLYDSPPLEAVVDTAVNKMVLQRLKARKAEITTYGGVYAKVEPPSYLPEEQYFDRVADDDWDGEGEPPTKLERALTQNLQNAFDTLKDWQNGTVMAIPDNWTLEQLEIPETDDPVDDQIRGYNRDISRRLLIPLDLVELQSGSELSRETMFATLMTTIAGWRREIKRIFDQYGQTVADIEGIGGSVEHTFPPLKDADTQNIISALQFAGIGGLTEQEVRQMMNAVQGINLETDPDSRPGQPAPDVQDGGPDDPDQRQGQMEDFLEDQRRGPGDQPDPPGEPQPPQEPGQASAQAAAVDDVSDALQQTSTSVRQANSGDTNSLQFDMDFGVPSIAPPKPSKVTVAETTTVTGGTLALPRVPQRVISRDQLEARIEDMLADITDADMPLFARVAERDPDWEPFVDIGGGVDPDLLERLTDELPRAYMNLFDSVNASKAQVGDDTLDADWNPIDHPRGEDGKFIEGPGASEAFDVVKNLARQFDDTEDIADSDVFSDQRRDLRNPPKGSIVRMERGLLETEDTWGVVQEPVGSEHTSEAKVQLNDGTVIDTSEEGFEGWGITHIARHPAAVREERQARRQERQRQQNLLDQQIRDADFEDPTFSGQVDNVPDDTPEPLREALETGRLGGIGVEGEVIDQDDVPDPWGEQDVLLDQDGVVMMVDVDDWANVQTEVASEGSPSGPMSRREFFEGARPDDVQAFQNILEGEEEPRDPGIPLSVVEVGSSGQPTTFQEGRHRTFAAKLAGLDQMPVAVTYNPGKEGTVDANAPDVQAARLEGAEHFEEGDEVDTPDGQGVVVEIRTEPFEGPDGDVPWASEDEPAYVTGVEDGAAVFRGSDLELLEDGIQVDGVDNPEADLADGAEAMLAWYYEQQDDLDDRAAAWLEAQVDDGRRFDYPPSWDDSPTPNRIILLKAWAGLGGRFTSCRREMTGQVASPSRFCASMKDRVLNWEGWRQGG